MALTLFEFKTSEKGATRIIARFNKIIANLPKELNLGAKNLVEYGQIEGRRIINESTLGNGDGLLAKSWKYKTLTTGKGKNAKTSYTLGIDSTIANYGGYVNDGFAPHWVTIQDKPNLKKWLEKNLPAKANDHKIFIGGPNGAPWIKDGLHFMEKSYAKMLGLTEEEITKRIQNLIRGTK